MPISKFKCTTCKELKPVSSFYSDKSASRGHEAKCKICALNKTRERTHRNRQIIVEYKLAHGCIDCGYNQHAAALEFDHVRGTKIGTVSSMTRFGIEALMLEIAKCEVRCSNCHHVKSYYENLKNKR